NQPECPGASLRPATPEGYRELRDFKIDPDCSDSEGEDVMAALAAFNDSDHTITISLNQDDTTNSGIKIKIEADECQLKPTEDSTALKNAILGPQTEAEVPPTAPETQTVAKTESISETGGSSQASTISPKDDLSLLNINIDNMVRDSLPDMDSNDVDEIFKGVLTDDSQESQESSVSYVNSMAGTPYSQPRRQLQSPMDSYASPYHTDFGSKSVSFWLY
ncbi:Histone-lysine N-methyltransferase trr, partial [Operophtera brumata]